MKSLSARQLALIISALIVSVEILYLIVLSFFEKLELPWWVPTLLCIGSFFLVFFLTQFLLYRFIIGKVKVVYRSIQKKNRSTDGLEDKFRYRDDVLTQVNDEVTEWVEKQRKEIAQLKQMEAYRKEFIGNVSHELKTPIFVMQGYILTLLDGGLEDPAINWKYLEKAEKSIDRMITIVQDLETISRLEHGELKLNFTRFDICMLVKETFESLEEKARKKKIRLTIKEGYNSPTIVFADIDRIRQVLVNLVVNSINYGKEQGMVRLAFYDMDENILVEVKDNGMGIKEDHIPRLFERFYRVDKSRSMQSGGTGLGLAIVKHIIEAHKQTINVKSSVGVGSTFAFTLKKR